jgi:hypothetical protein
MGMRRRRVGVVDLLGNRPAPGLWNRLMKPNFASIMPQVVAVWCEQLGHDVTFVCHTGREDLTRELPSDLDVLFIAAFTNAAQRAAAISAQYRARGTVTVIGGPHARCYPHLAANEGLLTRSLNFVRAASSEGRGRIRHDATTRGLFDSDLSVRRFFEGDTVAVPRFCAERVRHDLGPLWGWLPAGGLEHDANAYLKSVAAAA